MKPELILGIVAMTISAFALGWNIYRDLILKARLKVKISVVSILFDGKTSKHISVEGTNWGPGQVTCKSIICAKLSIWRFFSIKSFNKYGYVVHKPTCQFGDELPKKLEIGENINILFDYRQNSFLANKITHIGICDSYSITHWAPKKSLNKARKDYLKDFKEIDWGKQIENENKDLNAK